MQPYHPRKSARRHNRSRPAFLLLILFGCTIIFFSLVLVACAFVINYADDFETPSTLEDLVQPGFNYCQYWAGIPFLITGILVLFSGIWQRSRALTITTVVFCYLSVALMLLVLAVDSGNFYKWNFEYRKKVYWDSKSGFSCSSTTNECKCGDTSNPDIYTYGADCDDIAALSALYGMVIGSAVIIALFCFLSVTIITKSLTWKRLRYVQHMYYPEEFYMPDRRAPSVLNAPDTYRRGYGRELPYKQEIYRNYPY